jgi:2-keto-4-pentenoate hydratase/2-oxohepta-3-ene-1,7-dioic acid hydratase in catechol pathway
VNRLELTDLLTGATLPVGVRRLLVAGFTGREQEEVARHVEELRAFGAPAPETTPCMFVLDPALLTAADRISVTGTFTSGEVEPVVVVHDGARLLTVGSDHTDRDVERKSLADSKHACPKVIGTGCVPADQVADWDAVTITSWADGEPTPYQQGTLRSLLTLPDLEARLRPLGITLADGDVLFMGTVPVTGGELRPANRFRAALRVPGLRTDLTIDYHVTSPATG